MNSQGSLASAGLDLGRTVKIKKKKKKKKSVVEIGHTYPKNLIHRNYFLW
jgi:hypothetical protein